MKLLVFISFIAFITLTSPDEVSAQIAMDNHTVTVSVSEITLLQVSSGSVNLTITGANAVAGVDMMSTTDQSSSLSWGTNGSLKKITVQSNLAAPLFTLKVLALNPTQGLASPEVTLSSAWQDFLLNIGRTSGSCTLRYTGIAYASQGMGTDTHSITFTIQTQ
ncbi:MAG TPA: hypothetical protein VNN76_01920 [Bacteroidota bacterium]|nr:hypothetical protein [Bacteroidota bacterium]